MKLFGTDGIRGVAGQYPLDSATVTQIAAAAARVLKKAGRQPVIFIGRDTRESGKEIAAALKKGLSAAGIETWDLGVVPTPAVAYMVHKYPVLAGIVISASHNPYQDNGIKFFSHRGTKLPDAVEARIEKRIGLATGLKRPVVSRGAVRSQLALVKEYRDFLCGAFPKGFDLRGMRLVVDCANGATCTVAERVLTALGADIVAANVAPDGRNINRACGALHPENISSLVVKKKAHCGLAFDGDGDRIIFIDENGDVRDGDYLLSLTAKYLKERNKLKNNTLVTTVMANLGLFKAMEREGVNVLKTPVGDRYVFEGMTKSGAVIGGEQSGHIIFRRFLSTGDGILSALQVLGIMRDTGQPLSLLSGVMQKFPQVLLNTRVGKKVPLSSLPVTTKAIQQAEKELKSNGRVLVRYSGTENLLRVMIEGMDKDTISGMAGAISETAVKEINAL
jgi:phosphoglucosamine mutase